MTARPHERDEDPPALARELTESAWDRILPPIDESDPEWQAYVKRKVQESLNDPRQSIPADEVRRRILERHEARLRQELKN